MLWRCECFFYGWYGSNILAIWNSNRRRLDSSGGRGVIVSSMLGFVLFLNRFRGRLGEGLDMIGYLLVVVCVVFFVFFGTR